MQLILYYAQITGYYDIVLNMRRPNANDKCRASSIHVPFALK